MTVYIDQARNPYKRMVMSHMLADTVKELHAMAKHIGMKQTWFQGDSSCPHYDVCLSRRILALQAGAVEIDRRGVYEFIKQYRVNSKLFWGDSFKINI
jgi:Protein of unknown function (DUF4031)